MTLSDALTIKNLVDEIGGDIVLQRLKDEAREKIFEHALIYGDNGAGDEQLFEI